MPLLEVDNLTRRFGGLSAVSELSFAVEEGEIRGLIGPNGAGKTTTFNVITGFYRPTAGRIRYRGEDISGLSTNLIAKRGLVRTFQHTTLFQEFTVFKNVLVGVTHTVESGASLSEALAKHPRVFDSLYVNMVRAGEAGGVEHGGLSRTIPDGLDRLAGHGPLGTAVRAGSRGGHIAHDLSTQVDPAFACHQGGQQERESEQRHR